MTNKEWIKIWLRERDEVTKTYDVEAFKVFYRKWKARGLYQLPLPENDEVIERTMRKMVCNMKSATEEEKAEALEWLKARGSDASMFYGGKDW